MCFYTNYGRSGSVRVYIGGTFVGEVNSYFNDRTYTPQCGQNGTLTVRLKVGRYTYEAHDEKYTWKGVINVVENECVIQGFTDR